MISTADKEKIQNVIGFRYVKPIQEHLNNQGCLNKDGKPHSSRMVTNVMNGVPHAIIEKAIYEVVAIKKEEIKRREQILKG
ncbi:hypothetical protein [Tenacibaculum piscium]|uniref:hypothetical protein n=1 Tax=Tenacibaculum piscium TaxID=1458515 RepID=UPI001F2574A0|nr:hypothetical protein [Tenacibaculum piscium]